MNVLKIVAGAVAGVGILASGILFIIRKIKEAKA